MSVCEIPSGRPGAVAASGSRVMHFRPGACAGEPHTWQGVSVTEYKLPADHHCGVIRSVLAGETGEKTAFHVRYFEIAPGGHTTLEKHVHEHVVIVLRGRGEVQLGDEVHSLCFGDAIYVAPNEVHQLRNSFADEPFGFLCMVDAVRDRPTAFGVPAATPSGVPGIPAVPSPLLGEGDKTGNSR
jgi:quercetin dioxygenase-like cupin family protein